MAADAVTGGRSADETIRALYNLAAGVEQIARANGAGPTPQDPNEIVRYDPASLNKVQNDLMHGKGLYVVRVVVAQNSQKGEPLTIAFVDFPDQVLFRRGEVVASIDYEPGDDAQTIVLTMLTRMQNMLVDKGILTRMGGAPAGKSVQGPNFLSVITELQAVKSKVTVQVIAKEPITRVAGLGEIDLQVTG
ncbi:MAG TPA: hypothetical protein VFK80_01495 [Limnochordia bacterium]|nr:hypothetical protein [Limnochordia bacterium]